jgi:hypothetical protein
MMYHARQHLGYVLVSTGKQIKSGLGSEEPA